MESNYFSVRVTNLCILLSSTLVRALLVIVSHIVPILVNLGLIGCFFHRNTEKCSYTLLLQRMKSNL